MLRILDCCHRKFWTIIGWLSTVDPILSYRRTQNFRWYKQRWGTDIKEQQRTKWSCARTNDFEMRRQEMTVEQWEKMWWVTDSKMNKGRTSHLTSWSTENLLPRHTSCAWRISLPHCIRRSSFSSALSGNFSGRSSIAEGRVMPPALGRVRLSIAFMFHWRWIGVWYRRIRYAGSGVRGWKANSRGKLFEATVCSRLP